MSVLVQKAKKTKKHRKYGRNANFCLRYASSHRREYNKLCRVKKHLVRHPADLVAKEAADRLKIIGGR